jgi:hypothetical protein
MWRYRMLMGLDVTVNVIEEIVVRVAVGEGLRVDEGLRWCSKLSGRVAHLKLMWSKLMSLFLAFLRRCDFPRRGVK